MNQLNYRELSGFCEQLSMITKSGMMIYAGLQMIADDTTELQKKAAFQEMADLLNGNETLTAAAKSVGIFPEYFLHMIQVGEESGRLDAVFSGLASYYYKQHTMRENLKSAVLYPSVLVMMMIFVLVFLVVKVLPVFQGVYQSLGAEMSAWAVSMMNAGKLMSTYSFGLCVLIVLIAVVASLMTKTEQGYNRLSDIIGGKKSSQQFSVAAFTASMSMTIASGLNPHHAMALSVAVVPNKEVKKKLNMALTQMEETPSLVECLHETGLLSSTSLGILSIGESSGSLEVAMDALAQIYEDEYEQILSKRVSLIEPISVAVLSALVGTVLVVVMFPLLGILSSIG